jgi:hypothetical protein
MPSIAEFHHIGQHVLRLEIEMQRMVIVHMSRRKICSQNGIGMHYVQLLRLKRINLHDCP